MRRASAVGVLAVALSALTACTSASDSAPPTRTVVSRVDGSGAHSTWVQVAQRFLAELRAGSKADLAKAGAGMRARTKDLARAGRAVRAEATTTYRGWSASADGGDDLVVLGSIRPVRSAAMPSGSVWSCAFHMSDDDVPTTVRIAYCIGFGADDLPNGQTLFRLPVR